MQIANFILCRYNEIRFKEEKGGNGVPFPGPLVFLQNIISSKNARKRKLTAIF